MGRTIGRLGAIIGLGFWLAACSGSSKNDKGTPDPLCEPGSTSCDGLKVLVCSDDGSKTTVKKTCSLPQMCVDGDCADTACVPNATFCKGSEVRKCDSTGSGSKVSETCAKSQVCREDDDTATCTVQACIAGAAMCNGDLATTCLDDGSGPAKGGTDCAADKQTCVEGECQKTACTPGTKVCKDQDVYLCAKNGTEMSLLADCQAGTVCDGEKQACVREECAVGTAGCDGTRPQKCNAYGSGWDPGPTDCATSNQVCVAGSCKKTTCTANARFCNDGDVFQCDQAGVSSTLAQDCYAGYHCVQSGDTYAYCVYNECTAGQLVCQANVAMVCNPDNTWPSSGTTCTDAQYCQEGAGCKERVCEPGLLFCQDGDVYSCDWLGSHAERYQQCPTDTACNVTGDNYSCVPLPCSPGDTACLGNKVGTCAADGQSLSAVTDDCTTAGNVCGTNNQCAKTVVDVLGIDEGSGDNSEPSGYFVGDVVRVTSARKLTEMQLNLTLPPTRSLRWVVFEQTNESNFNAKQDWVVANQSGSAFFSSGPISYALKAGKTYLLGAVVSGGNTFTAYLDTGPFETFASFGRVLGRVENPYSASMGAWVDAGYLYQMKVTTAAP